MGQSQMEGPEVGSEDRVRTETRKDGVRHGIDRNREDRVKGSRESQLEPSWNQTGSFLTAG